jgi:hypothetical protein
MLVPTAGLVLILSAAETAQEGVDVKPGYVGLYGLHSCWSVGFTGPAYRENTVRASAEERFEKPSAAALAMAKRRVATVHVWPDSTMECGGEVPESVVVRDGTDANTLSKIPLHASTEARSNAFGVSKVFGEGDSEMTLGAFRALFDGGLRVIYVVTSRGRRGGWRVSGAMQAVHDATGWQAAQHTAKLQGYKDRFVSVCSPGSNSTDPVWLILDVLANALEPGTNDLRDLSKTYIPCLEQLRQGPDTLVAASAEKLLAKLKE